MTDWVKMPIRVGVYIKKMGKFQPFFSRINSALSQGYLQRSSCERWERFDCKRVTHRSNLTRVKSLIFFSFLASSSVGGVGWTTTWSTHCQA